MNIVNYARRTAQGALLACLMVVGATELGAQCTLDPLAAYAPVPVIPVYLDAGGQATVNGSVLDSYFQSDCAINDLSVRIYQNATGGPSALSENFGCATVGNTYTRYMTVRNLLVPGSESIRREFQVTVIDNLFPTIAAISNISRGTDPSTACTRVVTGIDAVTSDNCAVTKLTYTMTGATTMNSPATGINQASGVTFNLGTTTVTYTASDASGNSVSRSFNVTIFDNDAPSLTCPTPAGSYAMDLGRCYVTGLNLPPVTSDNCGGVPTVTYNTTGALTSSGSNNIGMVQFPAGTTNVTYTSVDAVGNSVSCGPFAVNVVDNQPPVFAMVPSNVTIGTNTASGTPDLCDASYTWQHPTATDNCGSVTVEISIDGGAFGPIPMGATYIFSGLGVHTIQYRATDMATVPNTVSTSLINITVVDNTPPVITPAPVSQIFNTTISATDCSKVITFDRPSIGAITDCAGAGSVTMQEVVVSGPDINVMSSPAVPAFNSMTGGGTVTVQFPAGITRIAYYWVDNAMNFDSVHYTFIVKDQVAPVAKCNNLTRNLSATAPGAYTLTAVEADNGSADFCPLGTTVDIANGATPYGATLNYTCANTGVNTYTLRVTDASGNTHTATCSITIVDNTAPVISCPANSVHSTGTACSYTGLTSGAALTASDNCSVGDITWAVSGATTASGMGTNLSAVSFNKGNNTVLFTVKDNATPPNQSTCSFSVSVVDDVDPVLTVNTTPAVPGLCSGGVITRNVNTVSCTYFASAAAPIWSVTTSDPGSCSLPVNVTTIGGLPTGTYQLGDTPISITAVDASGNVTSCNFVVSVKENIKPNAICKDTTINLSTAPVVITASSFNNNSTDNCTLGSALTLELIDAMGNVIPGINVSSTSCSGSLPAILKVTDFNNNWDTCHAKVVLNDNIPPTCGVTNPTIALNASGTATIMASAINSGSNDNCGLHLTMPFAIATSAAALSNNATSLTFNCNNLGANTVHFKATDKSGNICTTTATVTVVDNIAPVGTGPADESITCDVAANYLSLPVTISVVENCTYTVTKLADVTTSLGCPNNYQVLRTWEVRDVAGNTHLVYQTVIVEDDQKPVITLPANSTLNLSAFAGNCHPTVPYTASVTDNCGGMVTTTWEIKQGMTVLGSGTGLTATPSAGYNIGLNTITFRATDACGNTITNSMTVTVVDDAAPIFSTYYVPATASTSYCNHPTFVYSNTFNTCAYTFNWVRPWTGDLSDCSSVTFGPESIVANTPTGIQTLTANFPWATTNSLTEFVPVSISLPVGTTTFTYTAIDAAGRTATCSFNVQVNDTQQPSLSGVQTATLASICPSQKVPDYRGLAQINDNCPSNVTLTQSIISPNNVPWIANTTTLAQVFSPAAVVDNATFVVRITATDGVNPVATRDITVTLDDNVAPVPDVTNLSPDTSYCGYIILPTPTAKTNDCGNNTGVTVFGTPGGVSALAETTDMAGNIASYRVTLPPNPGQPTCQTYFITWSYNDGNGNVATQPQTVTVCPDLTPPVAKCKTAPVDVVLNTTSATITPATVDGGSYDEDNCNTFILTLNKTTFTCADVSTTAHPYVNVVLTATSTANSAHTDTCHARIRVVDQLAPSINLASVPADITVDTCAIGYMPPAAPTVTAVDSCGATVAMAQTSTQTTSGAGKYNYAITRVWTATDLFGNTSTAQQVITVRDNKKPVFTTPANITVNTLPVTNNCSAVVQFKLSDFLSDCAPDSELTVVVTPPYFNMTTDITETLPVGNHNISISATDPSGNVATTAVLITVKDATKPIASCINGISVALNANGQAVVTPQLVNNQSYDNCTLAANLTLLVQELDETNGDTLGDPASELIFDCFEADNDTEYPLILWVKDQAGNFNFCETYVVIQDNVAPTLTCPANVTIECSNNPAAFSLTALGNATVTDNCLAALPTPTYTDVPASTPGYLCGSRMRIFKVTDISGNTATCTQTITVVDNKPPVFSTLPQSDTILCNDPLVTAPVLTAIDNCTPSDSINIVLTQVKSDSVGVCGKYQYKVTRTWKATDKCGNIATHIQVLTVRDTLGPVFLGMPDTLKVLTANYAPAANCTAPVEFNAAQYFSECALLSECTINAITFQPALAITPTSLNVSGNYPMGNTKIFFRVTDPCGNVGRDSIVINVRDNSSPTMICNNSVEIVLSSNGQAELETGDIDLGSNDNCGIDTMYLSKTLFDCEDLGVNQITLTAVDVNNNANSCTVAVTVTAGPNTGFTLTTNAVAPTYFGAANGSATATVTSGSGTFTYKWSNNATTANANGLVAGTYTVTVTDSFTGCKQTATVTVQDGPKVLFTVGNATGAQNTIVKVPVTVTNFQQLSGFTFSLNVANSIVGTIGTPAVTNINAALGTGLQTSVSGNTLSVLYLNSQGQNIDLPNGTVLFNLCVQLSGASLGSVSTVNVENTPVQFTVIRQTGNGPLTIATDAAVNGSVQITQGLNDYDLGGDIYPWQDPMTGVPGVVVSVTGPTTPLSATTPATGAYLFNNIVANTNTTTAPAKSQAGNTKIDIIDQGLMLKHIFATASAPSPLTSAYQRVAADVNFDGVINIVDFALVQRLLLGTVQHLEGVNARDWVFIPKSYTFPTNATQPFPSPTYPSLPVFPRTIAHNPLIQDELGDDFVAVRMGDLNGDAPFSFQQTNVEERNGANLQLRVQNQGVVAGQTVELAVKAQDFTAQKGYQFTFAFDPNVFELQNIVPGAVPGLDADANFGTVLLSEGLLSTAWVSTEAVSLDADATLFTLHLKALASVASLDGLLDITNDLVQPIALDALETVNGVALELTNAEVTATQEGIETPMTVYQNQPNPFRTETTIGFRLPKSDRATVRVYTVNGRLVKTFIGNFEQGYNAVQVRKSDLSGAGVYWYEVTSGAYSDRKKMIILD